jgi:type II secretion system protein L
MKILGLSITRDRLSAVLLDKTLFRTRTERSFHVACREPYGSPGDVEALAEEIRGGNGGKAPPAAVIVLPSAWSFLRPLELPVNDLSRAKKIHVAELDGSLPIEDEEILSDILPAPHGRPGRFLAIAARRSAVEKAVAAFTEAGFAIDRVVTDHVAILAAVLAGAPSPEGLFVATLSDIVVLHVEGGAVVRARQFPAAMHEMPEDLLREWRALMRDLPASLPMTVIGDVPPPLRGELSGAASLAVPGDPGDGSSLLALGAALAPSFERRLGGFSLRTSFEAESALMREKARVRFAAAAAAAALLASGGALQTAKWAEARKVALVQEQIRKEVVEAAPDIKRVVNPTAQFQERIQALSRERRELGIEAASTTDLLARVSEAFPAKEEMAVREVMIDAGRLRLSGETGSARLVETYRSSLASVLGPGAVVTVESSQGSAREGTVQFTILIDAAGNGSRTAGNGGRGRASQS